MDGGAAHVPADPQDIFLRDGVNHLSHLLQRLAPPKGRDLPRDVFEQDQSRFELRQPLTLSMFFARSNSDLSTGCWPNRNRFDMSTSVR